VVSLFVGAVGGMAIVLGLAHIAIPERFVTPEGTPRQWWANWRTRSSAHVRIRGAIIIGIGAVLVMDAMKG